MTALASVPAKIVGKRILVDKKEAADMTPGGIVIPATSRFEGGLSEGVVVAHRKSTHDDPCPVEHGDVILFFYPGTEVEVNGETLWLIDEESVALVLD